MVADRRDDGQSRPPFVNWPAMTAVLLAARRSRDLPYFRLQMELASRVDPSTGTARASLRELATALHHRHTLAWRRREGASNRTREAP
jgi:hypothetical protein